MKSFLLNIKNKNKGVTLLETLVAIFVLVTGIVGAFSLIISVMSFTSYNSNKLIASYLAQEGVELVRNIRDTNWQEGWNYYDGLSDHTDATIDYNDNYLDATRSGELYIGNDGFYDHDNPTGGDLTIFTREISTNNPISDGFLKIIVNVSWEEKGKPYYVEVIEYLYNWY